MSHEPTEWRSRFTYPTVGFPQWSSDDPGRLVFVSNEAGVTQVWTARLDASERRQVTDQRVGVEEFVLSPDGSAVAWWSDDSGDGNGGWVATALGDGSSTPLLTGVGAGWSEGLAWSGDRVAMALTDGLHYRVYVGEVGAQARVIYESTSPAGLGREWTLGGGGLSADGELICIRHSERGDMLHFGLRVVRQDGSIVQDLVDEGRTVRVAAWSPQAGDSRVAIIHELDGVERPAIWNPVTGERRSYPAELPGEIEVNGWYPEADALLVTHWHDGRSQLYRVDVVRGEYAMVHDPHGFITGARVRPSGEVWLREESGVRAPRVRDIDGSVVLAPPGEPPLGAAYQSMRFEGADGDATHMMVAVPEGPGPHPIVMHVHGGPEWADADAFDPWTATLVDHGVVVAKVNYRGSTGFGERWRTHLYHGNIGFSEVSDVVSGLSYLVDLGIADGQRAVIEGWSWGGYITALAVGLQPDAFVAAIAGIPVCDSVMTHEDCSPSQRAYDLAIMGGSPNDVPERYAERSPSTYLDAVRTPLLIIAGEHDSACPIRQVRWYTEQLEDRGREVTLHTYDAGHHANSVDERIGQVELELRFLAEHGVISMG